MDSSTKFMIAHIVGEIIVIGGISYVFSKKIALQNEKIAELEKKLQSVTPDTNNLLSIEQFSVYQKQTNQHINKLYGVIDQLINKLEQVNYQKNPEKINELNQKEYETKNRFSENISSTSISQIGFVSISPMTNKPEKGNIEIVEDIQDSTIEEKYDQEVSNEDLDAELESELNELEVCENQKSSFVENEEKTNENEDSISLKITNDTSNTTPLEFVIPSSTKKKVVKKTVKK